MKALLTIGLVLAMAFSSITMSVSSQAMTNEEYEYEIENREAMAEAVRELDLPDDDQEKLVEYVIQDGARANSEGLRDSDISDESWEEIRDDARFE